MGTYNSKNKFPEPFCVGVGRRNSKQIVTLSITCTLSKLTANSCANFKGFGKTGVELRELENQANLETLQRSIFQNQILGTKPDKHKVQRDSVD